MKKSLCTFQQTTMTWLKSVNFLQVGIVSSTRLLLKLTCWLDSQVDVNQSFQVLLHTRLSWRTTQVTSSILIRHVLVTLTTTQSTKICFTLLVLQTWPSSSTLYWTAKNTSSDLSLGTWLKPTKLVVNSLQTWHMCLRSKATSQFQQTVVSHLTKTSTKLLKG